MVTAIHLVRSTAATRDRRVPCHAIPRDRGEVPFIDSARATLIVTEEGSILA